MSHTTSGKSMSVAVD